MGIYKLVCKYKTEMIIDRRNISVDQCIQKIIKIIFIHKYVHNKTHKTQCHAERDLFYLGKGFNPL